MDITRFVIVFEGGQWHAARHVATVNGVPVYALCEAVFDSGLPAATYVQSLEETEL